MATTITKRNTGTAAGGATKRVTATADAAPTKRVTATAAGGQTARVNRDQYTSSIYDSWGGSWGQTWQNWWLVLLGNAPLGHRIRTEVPQQPASLLLQAHGSPHPHSFPDDELLLEDGGQLLFEDIQESAEGQHTKRVAAAVT